MKHLLRGIPLLAGLLWTSVQAASAETAAKVDRASAASPESAPDASASDGSDASALVRDVAPVLSHAYAGIDTAALLARIQKRLQWGEKDDLLIEAEGILYWDHGDTDLAMPCFERLSKPGALAMGFFAEGLMRKGDRYEAAGWFLKSARASRPEDANAAVMLRRYLEIKPGETAIELELAGRLEKLLRYPEAADLYWKHRDLLLPDTAAVLRVGAMLASQGRAADAVSLYAGARASHPENRALCVRLAETQEAMGRRLDAAKSWFEAWTFDATDSTARNRAIAQLEGAGPEADGQLKGFLENALRQDSASAGLNFKMAGLYLRAQDRKGAYKYLDRALKASPGNPAYQALLIDAIEGDSLIQANFSLLKTKYEKEGASVRLALMIARGYSLQGDKPKACRAWNQLAALSPKSLEGRRDAFLDLAACGDPASLAVAAGIGESRLAAGFDSDVARTLVQIDMRRRDYSRAAAHASQLAVEPSESGFALSAAKALLDARRDDDAKAVLAAIAAHAPMPEAALLLGRMEYAVKDWASAAEQFRVARDSFPDAGRLRGECLAAQKDYANAAAEYENHFARTGDKESLRAAARFYREAQNASKEAEALSNLVDKGWAGDEDKLRLASLATAQDRAPDAMNLYDGLLKGRSALPSGPDWVEAALAFGVQMAREGKLDKAIHALTLGLKGAPAGTPGLADAWNRLGECLAEKREWKEAQAAYASALAIDSLNGEAAGELLLIAKKLDSKKEIGDAYRTLSRLDTANEEANAYLAGAAQSNRDYKTAAMHYRRVANNHPNDGKAWENLGNALALIPDLSAASAPLQTAIDLGAQSDEVYINRARAYRQEGAKDMAASMIEFMLNRNPRDYLAVLWSAKFDEEDGKQSAALELYKKSSKLPAPRSAWPELANQGMQEAKVSINTQE